MYTKIFILIIILTLLSVSVWGKQPEVEVSGFGDFLYSVQNGEDAPDNFSFGQVEIDLETSIEKKIIISAAVAFDPESETFGMGAFIVDLHLLGTEGDHFRRGGLKHSGIILGQFDVPFGIDWMVYPSIDRKLTSIPLVVENTHHAWNDYGIQGYLNQDSFDLTLFATNGLGYEIGYDSTGAFQGYNQAGYNSNDPDISVSEIEMKMSAGGRIGFRLQEAIEVGTSYAVFLNADNKFDMSLFGADIQFNYNNFHLKSEFIAHGLGLEGNNSITNSGFYAQGLYELNRLFLVGRYNMLSVDFEGIDDVNRFDAGLGWIILDGAEARIEHQFNSVENSDITLFQMVVGF